MPTVPAVSVDPLVGRVLGGRYRVGPRIARGGMATVYEATDLRLDRLVAVKVMHAGLADDPEFTRRFVQEAHAAARLAHPGVVAVHDQGADDDVLYLVMELVPGGTLRDLVRAEAPLPPGRALALLAGICEALAAAHRAGYVHRDVKPENVLLTPDGRVKVADFGLVRAVSAATSSSATGVLVGTVSYLAPEQVLHGRTGTRSDVYAVGVVAYELLTGAKPHVGDSPIQVAYAHVHADVPPPSAAVPGVPPYLDAFVRRATARDPDRRPSDAQVLLYHVRRVRRAVDLGLDDDAELTEDLSLPTAAGASPPTADAPAVARGGDDHEDTRVSPAEPDESGGRRAPRRRRRRRIWLAVATVMLLLGGGAAGAWYELIGRFTTVPTVTGLTVDRAEQRLGSVGLSMAVAARRHSETVPAGAVMATRPEPGGRVLDDGRVVAVVSVGPRLFAVPPIDETTLRRARQLLAERRLGVGELRPVWSERTPAGEVVRVRPDVGERLRRGTSVTLTVSRGPRPIHIPRLVGTNAERAERRLERAGFTVKTTSRYDDDMPRGDVLAQRPAGGTGFRGDTVRLVVSRGPELVAVPSVRGMSLEAATTALRAVGFQVQARNSELYVGAGLVVLQDPAAETEIPKGSVVTVYLV